MGRTDGIAGAGVRASGAGSDRWTALLVVLVGTAVLAPGAFFGLPFSKVTNGGMRVLDGEFPYRDFWSLYAPGMFFAVAALFAVFGRVLLVQGLAAVVTRGISAGFFFLILRRLGVPRRTGAFLGIAFAVMFFQVEVEFDSYTPALFFILVALYQTVVYLDQGGLGRMLGAGVLLGLAACFKHDVAAYAAIAISGGLSLAYWAPGCARPAHWLNPFVVGARLAAGCALVLVPTIGLVAWQAGGDAWENLIVYPSSGFLVVRTEEFPALPRLFELWRNWSADWTSVDLAQPFVYRLAEWLLCHLPEAFFLFGLVWVVVKRRALSPLHLAAAAIALIALPLYWMAAHVQTNTHLYSMATFAGVLGAVVWVHSRSTLADARSTRFAVGAAACIYLAALMVFPVIQARPVLAQARHGGFPPGVTLPFPSARGLRVYPREQAVYEPFVRFVRENTAPDESIYVGVTRHDAIVIGDERFYGLCERRCATRYNELHPGVIDMESVQREMIADLEEQGVRCVILWDFGRDGPWAEALDEIKARRMAQLEGAGSELLDDYIRANFELLDTRGDYQMLWRRDAPGPGEG